MMFSDANPGQLSGDSDVEHLRNRLAIASVGLDVADYLGYSSNRAEAYRLEHEAWLKRAAAYIVDLETEELREEARGRIIG